MFLLTSKKALTISSLTASILSFSVPLLAQSTNYNIGNAQGGQWALLTTWMQQFVSFINGPFGYMAVVVALVIAFVTWMFAPREGIVGPALRVVTGAIVILNVATWLASF